MSPEAVERRRLSKATRKQIRESKRGARQVIGVTQPSPDTRGFDALNVFILLKVGPEIYREIVAPNILVIQDYFQIRCEALTKGSSRLVELNKQFMEKHDPDLLAKLKIIFPLVTEYVGRLPR